MKIKNVDPQSFMGRHWRGICFKKDKEEWRINFKVEFEFKDTVKAFCKERAGTWDSFEKAWFVTIDNQKLRDGTVSEWLATGISEFGDGMMIGDCIEWCFWGDQKYVPTWEKLFKQTKKQSLSVIDGGAVNAQI